MALCKVLFPNGFFQTLNFCTIEIYLDRPT